MSTDNAKIRIRGGIKELKLTIMHAEHIMDNDSNFDIIHDLSFLEIQRHIKHCKWEKEKGNYYKASFEYNQKLYHAFVLLTPNVAVIKTCFKSRNL